MRCSSVIPMVPGIPPFHIWAKTSCILLSEKLFALSTKALNENSISPSSLFFSFSRWERLNIFNIHIRPARESLASFICFLLSDPVSQNKPVSSDSSHSIFMYSKSSGAFWASSIKIGGWYTWKKRPGSLFASSRSLVLSRLTYALFSPSASFLSIVDLPTCLAPVIMTALNTSFIAKNFRSSSLFIYSICFLFNLF